MNSESDILGRKGTLLALQQRRYFGRLIASVWFYSIILTAMGFIAYYGASGCVCFVTSSNSTCFEWHRGVTEDKLNKILVQATENYNALALENANAIGVAAYNYNYSGIYTALISMVALIPGTVAIALYWATRPLNKWNGLQRKLTEWAKDGTINTKLRRTRAQLIRSLKDSLAPWTVKQIESVPNWTWAQVDEV